MVCRRSVLGWAATMATVPVWPGRMGEATAAARHDEMSSPGGMRVLRADATGGIDARAGAGTVGGQGELRLARGRRMVFVRFTAADFDPDRVHRAKLRFAVTAQESEGGYWPVEIYGVDGRGWDERTLSWHNAPRHAGDWLERVDVSSGDGNDPRGWYEVDVTGYVRQRLENGEPVAFRIDGQPDRDWWLRVASRTEVNSPELVLFEEDPVPSTGRPAPMSVSRCNTGSWLRYQRLEDAVGRTCAAALGRSRA